MSKITYIYFGDNIFQKLENLADLEASLLCSKLVESKTFNCLKISHDTIIDDVFLGWSFIVLRTGNKFYHAGFTDSKSDLTEVFSDEQSEILCIACGTNIVYAVTKGGKLYSYTTQSFQPVLYNLSDQKIKIKQLITGDSHNIAMMEDGSVFLLQLAEKYTLIPISLPSAIAEVACGKEHAIFLSTSGQVFSYGCGSRGQLGHGGIENGNKPVLLEALDGIQIKAIACGGWHSAAVSYAGDLYMWGWNESGQLGFPCAELHNNTPLSEIETICCLPKIVEFGEDKCVISVSCGTRHTGVLTDDFEVWTWGWNEYGQLGHDKFPLCDKPVKLPLANNFIPKKIKCAFWSTVILGTITS